MVVSFIFVRYKNIRLSVYYWLQTVSFRQNLIDGYWLIDSSTEIDDDLLIIANSNNKTLSIHLRFYTFVHFHNTFYNFFLISVQFFDYSAHL